MLTIILASSNNHKKEEIQEMLSPFNIKVLTLKEANIKEIDIEENGTTFSQNALIKANAYAKYTNLPILSDDSGLEIESMENKPGIRSSRYAQECGSYLNAFKDIFKKIDGKKRNARFVCCMVLINFEKEPLIFKGECKGKIIDNIPNNISNNSFGYDPIFKPNGYEKTFDQLSKQEKNKISHRHNALIKLINHLKEANIL